MLGFIRKDIKFSKNVDKKTDKELYRENHPSLSEKTKKKKTDIRKTIILLGYTFFLIFFGQIIEGLTLGNGHGRFTQVRDKILTIEELPDYIGEYFIIAIFVSIILSLFSYYFFSHYKKQINTVICENCFKVKKKDNISKCKCGGQYSIITNYKWIE